MALFGTAFNSGVDIYTKHFLFSAENIASVKNLTLKALSTHQDAVLDQGNLSFQDAVMRLNDNQAICTPRSIALLAKQAIAVGDVEPATTSEELAQKGEDQDQTALLKLNEGLGFDGAMQKERAYYFWWSQFGPELQSARVKENIFVQGFDGMKKDSVPYDVKLIETPNWKVTYQDKVRAALNLLSSHTKSEFRSNTALQAKQFVSVDVAEAQYEAEVADAKLGIRVSPSPQKFTTPTSSPPKFTEAPTSRSGFVSLTVK
jgi:hypothetical protein